MDKAMKKTPETPVYDKNEHLHVRSWHESTPDNHHIEYHAGWNILGDRKQYKENEWAQG